MSRKSPLDIQSCLDLLDNPPQFSLPEGFSEAVLAGLPAARQRRIVERRQHGAIAMLVLVLLVNTATLGFSLSGSTSRGADQIWLDQLYPVYNELSISSEEPTGSKS